MNPHAPRSINPLTMIKTVYSNRDLIFDLIKRDVVSRYKGSAFGVFWSFLNPLLLLAVYTFLFSVVFKARWAGGGDSKVEFALVLFSGLLFFNLFAEVANRAPALILSNVNYVKKVVFPLEILPVVTLGAAAFHMIVSLIVWFIFYSIFIHFPDFRTLQVILIMVPLALMSLGVAWFFASLGVYLRDIGQIMGFVTTVLMFLSPIFYPMSALPEKYKDLMLLNPLTFIVEDARNVMIWEKGIDWWQWGGWTLFSFLVAWLGFVWFEKTRKGFSDVL